VPASDRCSDGQIVSLSTKGGVYTRIEKANSYWFLLEGGLSNHLTLKGGEIDEGPL